MNAPSPVQPPASVAAVASLKMKLARESDLRRNREIGHVLKSTSAHRPNFARSLPHSRGR